MNYFVRRRHLVLFVQFLSAPVFNSSCYLMCVGGRPARGSGDDIHLGPQDSGARGGGRGRAVAPPPGLAAPVTTPGMIFFNICPDLSRLRRAPPCQSQELNMWSVFSVCLLFVV